MNELEEKCMRFVMKHYKPGQLDTSAALRKVKGEKRRVVSMSRRIWYGVSGVAAALIVCLASYIYMNTLSDDMVQLTADGAVAKFILPDSTHVTLSPHSQLTYNKQRFGKGGRDVTMNGQIYFSVHHDEESPFRVTASNATVRVLGTRFEVYEHSDTTSVFVNQGRVLFTAPGEDNGMILTKGMSAAMVCGAFIDNDGQQMPNPSAWATGLFVYDDTPLPVVLTELSAFYHVNLSTKETDKRLSAEFDTDNLDNIIDIIEQTLDIHIAKN